MNNGYIIYAPRVQIFDKQTHTITKELVTTALISVKCKQKKLWSIVCIVIACFILELGIATVFILLFWGAIFLAGGGIMLHLSIKSLKQSQKNIQLIENGNYHFEKAVCSEILYNTEGLDTMCFKDKDYSTTAIKTDCVGAEYYLLFLDKETCPTIVFETSNWVLEPNFEIL